VPIVYTKPRPGEKLFEDMLSAEEGMVATRYQKIFRAKTTDRLNNESFIKEVENLKKYIHDPLRLTKRLTKLIK